MEKKYVANKAMIVNSEGKILLMRDAGVGDHANSVGRWCIPGGRMEHGETPMEALKREIREEVGIEIDVAKTRPIHVDIWGVGGDVENEPIIGIFYLVEIDGASPMLSEEHTEYLWHDPSGEIPENTTKDVVNVLAAYKRLYVR